MAERRRRARNMTQGPIWTNLLLFAAPLLLSGVVQQMYSTVDLIFAGQLLGTRATAAIGLTTNFTSCLVNFFWGLSAGVSVLIARCFGNGDTDRLRRTIHTAVAAGLLGGAALILVGWSLAPVFLKLTGAPEETYDLSLLYLRVYSLSFPAIVLYNVSAGVLRALGDSRHQLYAQFVGGLMNIAANYFLIQLMENGVAAVALASLASQTVSSLLCVYWLHSMDSAYALCLRSLRIERKILGNVLLIGIPSGLQAVSVSFSNIIVQYFINSLGAVSIAAFTAYYRVELIMYFPIMAMGQSIMTFTAQNHGAREPERIRKGLRGGLALSVGITIALSLFAIVFRRPLLGIFSKDPAVILEGTRIIMILFPFYFLYDILQFLGDVVRGLGNTKGPMIATMLIFCGLRPAMLFLRRSRIETPGEIAAVYLVTWLADVVAMMLLFLRERRKLRTEMEEEASVSVIEKRPVKRGFRKRP